MDRRRTYVGWPVRQVIVPALCTIAIATTAVAQQPRSFRRPSGAPFVPGQIIVKFKPGATGLADPSALGLAGVERVRPDVTSGGEVLLRVPAAAAAGGLADPAARRDAQETTKETVEQLRARPDVEYAEPNYLMYPLAPSDPRFAEQWDYRVRGAGSSQSPGGIGVTEVWTTNKGSAAVVVAVVDTGVLKQHTDIARSANQAGGYDMISDDVMANDGGGRDADADDPGDGVAANECVQFGSPPHGPDGPSWHGTHVASTIGVGSTDNGKSIAGLNWHVSVLSVRALGKCGGTLIDIADSIRWAAGLDVPGAPPNPKPARVINMSLGGGGSCSTTYQRAIDDAVARGAIVVVAAGNEHIDASTTQPASCRNVVTVAASDDRGKFASSFSNFGSVVDIMAPGARTLGLVRGGEAFYSGTSMATPHVAGVIALWLADHPGWGQAQVEEALRRNAVPRTAADGCPPNTCGAGLLSAKLDHLPDPGVAPSLSISPGALNLGNGTREQSVSAVLRVNGQPRAAAPVTFAVADPQVASVLPASASTGTGGEAVVLVRARGAGRTTLTASSGAATASAPVTVPSGSTTTALLAALGMLAADWLRCRRDRS